MGPHKDTSEVMEEQVPVIVGYDEKGNPGPLYPVLTQELKDAEGCLLYPTVVTPINPNEPNEESDSEFIRQKFRYKNIGTQVIASLSVSLGSMIVGFMSAYTATATASMESGEAGITIDDEQASWIGSLMPLSALFGGILGGTFIEHLGRKHTILGTGLPFVLSWLLIAFAQNVWMIYVGRAIGGFCVGIASLSLPVYLAETVQPEVRGTLGLLPTTIGNIGVLTGFVAGNYLNWSELAILGACLPVPFIICMCLIPETPRWYISKNKTIQAKNALQWLRGKSTDITSEMHEIENTHILSRKYATKLRDLFSHRYMKPMAQSLGLMLFQQLSGINAVIFYTVSIFDAAGSDIDSKLCTIIVGVVNFVATFVANCLIDKLGRKVLLYISDVLMILSLGILGTFFYMKEEGHDVSNYGWLPLVSLMVFAAAFSLGFGPIPWLMMGEVFPGKIRGAAAAFATTFNWSCTFLVTKTFTDIIHSIGIYGAFWLFAGILLVGLFFVIFCVPETRGKSLEDIERNLTGRPFRRVSSIANLKPLPNTL